MGIFFSSLVFFFFLLIGLSLVLSELLWENTIWGVQMLERGPGVGAKERRSCGEAGLCQEATERRRFPGSF